MHIGARPGHGRTVIMLQLTSAGRGQQPAEREDGEAVVIQADVSAGRLHGGQG